MGKYAAYPAYKESGVEWLGEIPKQWDVKRLKDIATYNDEALAETTDPDFEMEYVEISDVNLVQGITGTASMTFDKAPSRARRRVRDGDIIVSTVRTYLKAIAPVKDTPDNMIVSTGFAVIRPKAGFHPDYVGYLLQTEGFIGSVVANSTGVSYPAINASLLAALPVVTPPLPEQEAIARFLDHKTAQIDALIAKKEALLARLADKRTALISQAVTKGLDPSVPMRDSGIEWLGEIPAHWETTKIGYVSQVVRGQTPRPAGSPEFFYGDVLPWITVGEITKDSSKFLTSTQTMLTEAGVKRSIVFSEGTLVLTNSGATLGVPKILGLTGCMNDGVAALLNISPSMSKDYLFLFLHSMTKALRDYSQGMGQPNLNTTVISNLSVTKPPLSEQVVIAESVEEGLQSVETIQTKIQQAIDKLKRYRTALITNAVTGKIDVRRVQG